MVVSNIFYFHPYLGKIPNLTGLKPPTSNIYIFTSATDRRFGGLSFSSSVRHERNSTDGRDLDFANLLRGNDRNVKRPKCWYDWNMKQNLWIMFIFFCQICFMIILMRMTMMIIIMIITYVDVRCCCCGCCCCCCCRCRCRCRCCRLCLPPPKSNKMLRWTSGETFWFHTNKTILSQVF